MRTRPLTPALGPVLLALGVLIAVGCTATVGGEDDSDGAAGGGSGGRTSGSGGPNPTATGGVAGGGGPSGAGGRGAGGTILAGAGGRGLGGAGAGGRGAGGAPGSGGSGTAWLAGYTATMFGNTTTASDCGGVANFTDMTLIAGATCTHQGITIAPFSTSVLNNASYYGAPGDESSIWMGPLCTCQNGAAENAAGMCPTAPSCNMEGDCGRCFEIKCDPAGTGTFSDGATRVGAAFCNPNQSVVIQVIDACPHNHPSNTWWCTGQRKNHIDISCSAMRGIAGNPTAIGRTGWLNVQVRPVDCGVGLGVKAL